MLTRSERSLKAISTARKVLYLGNWHMCETVETVTQKLFIRVKLTIKVLNSTTARRYSGEICKNGIQTKSKTISLNTKIIYFNIDMNITKPGVFKTRTSV